MPSRATVWSSDPAPMAQGITTDAIAGFAAAKGLGQLCSLFAAVLIKPRKIYGRSLGQLNLCLLSGNDLECGTPCECATSHWNGLGYEPLLANGFVGHQALTGTRSQKANTVSR